MRVVNFAGSGLDGEGPIRLKDDDDQSPPPVQLTTRLRGQTLGIFGSNNVIRRFMHHILLWRFTELVVLLLIFANALVLTIQSFRSIFEVPARSNTPGYFRSPEDTVLFVLFVIFSLEALARIIVTGLFLDPESPISSLRSSLKGSISSRTDRLKTPVGGTVSPLSPRSPLSAAPTSVPVWHEKRTTSDHQKLGSMSNSNSGSRLSLLAGATPFRSAVDKQRELTETSRPYLRHSWNRVDAVAIVSFWIMFALCLTGLENRPQAHIYIFRALSVLRTTRLLAVTNGTTTIMRSLKKAAPQLVNVVFFVLFAIILFSIVGVQSFKGNFRRKCVVVGSQPSFELDQVCGGHINSTTLRRVGYIGADGSQYRKAKGYVCPLGQVCQERTFNPHGDAQHFDNILGSTLQILIVASANQWSPVMYAMMDADYFVSCVFFIICIIVLNFWLLNLFVAVITQSFSVIRAETKRSAFGAEAVSAPSLEDDGWSVVDGKRIRTVNALQRWYHSSSIFWALLALVSLTLQGIISIDTPQTLRRIFHFCEVVITCAFLFEIVWRVIATLPAWRTFFHKKNNVADMVLAIACGIILFPAISNSRVYRWLTIFQLARFYRVILLVPRMKALLFQVFGNLYGLWNMSIFLLIANFLAALFAVQLFRGDVDQTETMNFSHIGNSFIAMYQVFTSENWTDVLWNVGDSELRFRQQFISFVFVTGWLFFAYFILLQMFVAVINENFDVAEELKRAEQVQVYIRRAEPATKTINWIDRFNPYRKMKANPKAVNVESMPSNLVLPLKKTVVRDYRTPGEASTLQPARGLTEAQIMQGPLGTMRKIMGMDQPPEHVPLATLKFRRESAVQRGSIDMDETERQLEILAAANADAVEDNSDALYEARARKADFITDHPSYDKTLWIFTQSNPIRQLCQRLVPPSNGDHEERIFGLPPSPLLEVCFRTLMLVTVITGIIVASQAGPLYRRDYFDQHGFRRGAWFDIAEAVFGLLLVVEFMIKVVADGFCFTPNAYLLNIWNVLDLVILVAILINVSTTLIVIGGVARGTRALKAFRALRLVTLIPWMRETFHSVIFAGARRIIDAAILAILYMIPYAVWGLNIFSGTMFACNDDGRGGRVDCEGEFLSAPVDSSLSFRAPRVWNNPSPSTTFSFDSFGESFLILFEIVSLEGWVDVLEVALGITSPDRQPRINASQANAIFFLLYNLLGAVVILTLFVSIIISNFSSRSGMALLTNEQRQWIDLQKLIARQKPSKRPKIRPPGGLRSWCFDMAVKKHGWWSRSMTILYCIQIGILMSQTFHDSIIADRIRDLVYLALALAFLSDTSIKFLGLGWQSFCANGWNIFDVIVVLGSLATTVSTLIGAGGFAARQAQKLFLVCVAFKLIQKLDNLNQLFKTAVSSLGVITKLFGLWFALFFFFGLLFLEIFALTKWGSGETHNTNYQSLSSALVMLAFTSVGEGWNEYMHNFAIEYPRCTNSNPPLEPESDCGSIGWSYLLYISWNILSMYIFVNMFTGVVVENFSIVYHQGRNSNLNREEMRAFKKVWAQFDRNSTGYIAQKDIVPFFAKLSGVFDVRIYRQQFELHNIMETSRVNEDDHFSNAVVGHIDIRKLANHISKLDAEDTRTRRHLYNRLFWEARLHTDHHKGISFQKMLILLAHHKIIDDDKALKVEEIFTRRAVTEKVDDRVNLDKVRSLLRMIYHRRKFLAYREEKARESMMDPQSGIPAIVIAEAPSTPPMRPRDITLAKQDSFGAFDVDSPTPMHTTFNTSNQFSASSPEGLWSDPASPSKRHQFRASETSMSPISPGLYSSTTSSFRPDSTLHDPQTILHTLNTSVWGDMMQEAADDDDLDDDRPGAHS